MLQKPEILAAPEQAAVAPAAAESLAVIEGASLPEAENSAATTSDDPDHPGLLAESPETDGQDNEGTAQEQPSAVISGGEGEYKDFSRHAPGGR